MKKVILQVVFSIVILVLAYFLYQSIMAPVRFNKEYTHRSKVLIEQMKDIRTAQMMYKSMYGKYTGSFDTLIQFMSEGQIPVVKMIPDPEDTTFTRSIIDTVGYISVADSIFDEGEDPEMIRYMPFTDKEEIRLQAGEIEKGNIMVPVFEALADKTTYLHGLDRNLISQDRYKSIKVGSMEEPSTDGNWE